jgi:EAL domain-containing protein (putative c-di-GMP-specific phosphodiesterase class I)
MLTALGVDLGQGYLIGKPNVQPLPPRPIESLRLGVAHHAISRRVRAVDARARSRARKVADRAV